MRSIIHAALKNIQAGGIAGATAVVLALSACGGGGGTAATSSTTVTGKFVDATVVGLGYKCGTSSTLSGSTNASGQFSCNTGESVSFYVGGIKLGSVASAQAVVTPMDLVGAGATTSDPKVINIVRFLMSISSTAASTGTLTIDPAVVTAAATSAIDFSQSAPSNLDTVITAVKPTGATVATGAEATAHLNSSLFGLFAGAFSGSYVGSSSGTWSMVIDSQGVVTGTVTDSSIGTSPLTGTMATSMGTGSTYAFSGTGAGAAWSGTLNLNTRVFSGTWDGGTFTGKAAAAATPAASTSGGGTLIVSGVTPSTGNGNFPLTHVLETAAGGTSTAMRIEFTDATPATRTLRLYYQPGTGALENIQYESPQKNFNCFVGDPMMGCPTAKITFSAAGKSILLNMAEFKTGTTVEGVLEGHLTW
jgi:hypothetical protein